MIILHDLQWAEAVCGAPRAVSNLGQPGQILAATGNQKVSLGPLIAISEHRPGKRYTYYTTVCA